MAQKCRRGKAAGVFLVDETHPKENFKKLSWRIQKKTHLLQSTDLF